MTRRMKTERREKKREREREMRISPLYLIPTIRTRISPTIVAILIFFLRFRTRFHRNCISLSLSLLNFFFFDLSLLSFSRRYIRGVACALTLLSKNLYIETRLFYRLCVERNRQSRHRRVEERERKKKKSVTHDCVIFFSLSSSFLFFFIFLFSFSRK